MNSDSAVPKLEDILPKLSEKFSENVRKSLSAAPTALAPIEIKARAVSLLGELLKVDPKLQSHQAQLVLVFDEVFADLILSAYLGASCLDNAGRIVLRRALETGVALAFLWDFPCTFYGWTVHDKDLNFKNMVETLSSESYKTLLMNENSTYAGETVIDVNRAEALYREFSNVTHGKWATFESALPDRFSHNITEWTTHLLRISEVETILLNVWRLRFPSPFAELLKQIPALKGLK